MTLAGLHTGATLITLFNRRPSVAEPSHHHQIRLGTNSPDLGTCSRTRLCTDKLLLVCFRPAGLSADLYDDAGICFAVGGKPSRDSCDVLAFGLICSGSKVT